MNNINNNLEYDASHKASSVTSVSSNASSIWDPLPSLYTGRADSVSSAYELDDPQEPGGALFDEFNYNPLYDNKEQQLSSPSPSINIATDNNDQEGTFEYLNSFLDTVAATATPATATIVKKEQVNTTNDDEDHEVTTSSSSLYHGNSNNKKRSRQDDEDEAAAGASEAEAEQQRKDLLSNDQKRANHIASEQKRRNTIRGGFKELTEIIPTLKNINNSKSTILFKSVDYIKQLDKRNKSLRDKLALLQSRVQQKKRKQQQQPLNQQQKQLEFLQEQLRIQQELLTKHNIPLLYNSEYNSISIPCMDDTPLNSTTTSPIISHASLPSIVNNRQHHYNHHQQHSSIQHNNTYTATATADSTSIFIPADNDHSSAPSFTIPADFDHHFGNNHHEKNHSFRERLLSSGKLDHLKRNNSISSTTTTL